MTAQLLKDMASRYPTGVVVVTANSESGPAGFTAQTFTSLSLEPPLVSFAVATAGRSWAKMSGATVFAVNVLADDQESVAQQFATSGIDKFAGIEWTTGPLGAPLLTGALSSVEGECVSRTTYGDHDLIVLAARHVTHRDGQPLVYFHRLFRTLAE